MVRRPVAEAFFSILTREELSHNWYNSAKELDETIREYIVFQASNLRIAS